MLPDLLSDSINGHWVKVKRPVWILGKVDAFKTLITQPLNQTDFFTLTLTESLSVYIRVVISFYPCLHERSKSYWQRSSKTSPRQWLQSNPKDLTI